MSCIDQLDEQMQRALIVGAATVIAASDALPARDQLSGEIAICEAAAARGYFLPDEEEWVKLGYSQYLGLRASLLATIEETGALSGRGDAEWNSRQPLFATAFAAACVLLRANRFVVDLASKHSVLWKKLDEEDKMSGIPRKSFTTIYQALTSPRNQLRFLNAVDYYTQHRAEILSLANDPIISPIIKLLESEESFIEKSRSEVLKRRISYRWFSFLRRNRSAWNNVMRGMFEISERAVADLRQPSESMQICKLRFSN
jgi:hypothetical protein